MKDGADLRPCQIILLVKSFPKTIGLYGAPGGENVLKHHNKFMKRNLDQVYNLFLGDTTKKENKHKTI